MCVLSSRSKDKAISQVEEGGFQFATITGGKEEKEVFIKSDGETFEFADNSYGLTKQE